MRIIPGAEPFFFPGGRTGCLLIHGITGTPKEMRPLGEYLTDLGYTALGVRLTGHATVPADLVRARWEDWLTDVESGRRLLDNCCERIYVIGLSMGGMLALLHATIFQVSGIVGLSTLHHLPNDWRLPHLRFLSHIQPQVKKNPSDWHDLEAEQSHISYPQYPTRTLAELRDLMFAMRLALPKVAAPILLVNSKDDGVVKAQEHHADLILEAVASRDKTRVLIEGSGHVITRDAKKRNVFQVVKDFIDRLESGAGR